MFTYGWYLKLKRKSVSSSSRRDTKELKQQTVPGTPIGNIYFCSMTATAHVTTFLSCGHGLQNASSQVETWGSNSRFFEEYYSLAEAVLRDACQLKGALSPYHTLYVMWQFQIWIICLVSLGLKRDQLWLKIRENHCPKTIYALFSENCWHKILIILLIGLVTSRCFWDISEPTTRLVAWIIMSYHIIAYLNQVGIIIINIIIHNYFSWRSF